MLGRKRQVWERLKISLTTPAGTSWERSTTRFSARVGRLHNGAVPRSAGGVQQMGAIHSACSQFFLLAAETIAVVFCYEGETSLNVGST